MKKLKELWHDPVWSKVISGGILAALGGIALQFSAVRGWVYADVLVGRVQVILWCLLATAIGIAGCWWVMRKRQPRTSRPMFSPISVEDRTLGLEWRISLNPKGWLDDQKMSDHTPAYHISVLAGPYHLAPGCRQELQSHYGQHGSMNVLSVCPACEVQTFYGGVCDLFRLRGETIAELQRMHRNGKKLSGTVVLEKPTYWKELRPRPA